MNLQPIFPSRPERRVPCVGHGGKLVASSATAFADLDAAPGTYHCIRCMALTWTHNKICEALLARDQRELNTPGTLMNQLLRPERYLVMQDAHVGRARKEPV